MTRTTRRLLKLALAGIVTFSLAVGGLFAAWIEGIHVPVASGAIYMKVAHLQSASAAGEPQNGVVYIALVGTDLRPGVGGARGDALHLVAINAAQHRGTMIDFPRDICYGGGKINAQNSTGGLRGMAAALGSVAGVPVQYGLEVDFAGFTSMVDGVGGVDVNVEQPMNDSYSGAVFSPGLHHMNGGQALAYSRDRHDFPTSDLVRTLNQGHLLLEAAAQLRHQADSPQGRFHLIALLARHAQLQNMGIDDLFRLGELAFKTDPATVRNVPVPTTGGPCAGGLAVAASAASLFADFRDDGILESH
jgi:LCP family protein required for cell wall assembly